MANDRPISGASGEGAKARPPREPLATNRNGGKNGHNSVIVIDDTLDESFSLNSTAIEETVTESSMAAPAVGNNPPPPQEQGHLEPAGQDWLGGDNGETEPLNKASKQDEEGYALNGVGRSSSTESSVSVPLLSIPNNGDEATQPPTTANGTNKSTSGAAHSSSDDKSVVNLECPSVTTAVSSSLEKDTMSLQLTQQSLLLDQQRTGKNDKACMNKALQVALAGSDMTVDSGTGDSSDQDDWLIEGVHKLVDGQWERVSGYRDPNLHKLRSSDPPARSRRGLTVLTDPEDIDNVWYDAHCFESDGSNVYAKTISDKRPASWAMLQTHFSNPNKRLKTHSDACIRVGSRYQAFIPPRTDDFSLNRTEVSEPTRLFDPIKFAEAATRGIDVEGFVSKSKDLHTRMMLLESLHLSDYNPETAMKAFLRIVNDQKPELTHTLSANDWKKLEQWCDGGLIYPEKEFTTAAKKLGCSRQAIQVFYYNWKTNSEKYKRIKQKAHEDPDYCCKCDDGGSLIICDNCKKAYHFECHSPPVEEAPEHAWYCSTCTLKSPARLRFLESAPKLDSNGSSKRRLFVNDEKESESKATLRSVHKEIVVGLRSAKNKRNEHVPSGMKWDDSLKRWIDLVDSPTRALASPEAELELCNVSPARKLDYDDSDESDSDESETMFKPKVALSGSEESEGNEDPEFEPDDEHDDDDDDDSPSKATPSPWHSAPQKQPTQSREHIYDVSIRIQDDGKLGLLVAKDGQGVLFNYMLFNGYANDEARKESKFLAKGDRFLAIDGWSCKGKGYDEIVGRFSKRSMGQTYIHATMLHRPQQSSSVAVSKKPVASQTSLASNTSKVAASFRGPQHIMSPSVANNAAVAMGMYNRNMNTTPVAGFNSNLSPYQAMQSQVAYQQQQPVGFSGYQNLPPVENEEERAFRMFCMNTKAQMYPLLRRYGVKTVAQFVRLDAEKLSSLMVQEFGMDKGYARDFLGGMRLNARTKYAPWLG